MKIHLNNDKYTHRLVRLILRYANRLSLFVRGTMFPKENSSSETALQIKTDECDSSPASSPHFKLLRASTFQTLMCVFMVTIEELAVRVSVEQLLVSPL